MWPHPSVAGNIAVLTGPCSLKTVTHSIPLPTGDIQDEGSGAILAVSEQKGYTYGVEDVIHSAILLGRKRSSAG